MEEVTTVNTNDVGESNNHTSTLDSNNAISAATNGDREGSGSGHESDEADVSRRSKDKKVRVKAKPLCDLIVCIVFLIMFCM